VKRREFIAGLVGGAAAWPVGARAQDRMRQIAVLVPHPPGDVEAQARIAGFEQGLKEVGWIVGRNVRLEYRWSEPDTQSLQRLAKEIVELQPDLILSLYTPSTAAFLRQTRIVPTVFVMVSDPVGSGFVTSLPKPGGNITGFLNLEGSLGGKWLELLREIAPHVSRVAFLFNPATAPFAEYYLNPFRTAATSLGVEAIAAPVRDVSEIEPVITAQAREPNGGLIVMSDTFMGVHREQIVSLANRHRLPSIYPYRYYTELGGLLSYGIDPVDLFRRSAIYVDRIFKGAKPSELPVQAPSKFEFVINLKTARTLGLEVPLLLQQRADEVIE
jgi:putative ABC transport system substrate-binding protein